MKLNFTVYIIYFSFATKILRFIILTQKPYNLNTNLRQSHNAIRF